MSIQSSPEEAYLDRNQLAQAFARLALEQGWTTGLSIDPDEPDWPVLYVDTPAGQISWHLPKHEIIGEWPRYQGKWDGHTVEQKRARLTSLIKAVGTPANRTLG